MRQVIGSASATIWFVLFALAVMDILSRISGFDIQQLSNLFGPYAGAIELTFLSYTWLMGDLGQLVASATGAPELAVVASLQTGFLMLFAVIIKGALLRD